MPQGSKLGPSLYILCANNLVNNFKFDNIKIYANDFAIYAKINSEDNKKRLQLELNNFCKLVCKGQLKINYEQCTVQHFGRKNNNFVYNLDGNIIASSQSEKIHGVIIDTDISFKQNIYQYVDKANKMCNIILYSLHHVYLIDFIEHV